MTTKEQLESAISLVEEQKVYSVSEMKTYVSQLGINSVLLDSLYYFDLEFRDNVIRGIHIKNLLKERLEKEK